MSGSFSKFKNRYHKEEPVGFSFAAKDVLVNLSSAKSKTNPLYIGSAISHF